MLKLRLGRAARERQAILSTSRGYRSADTLGATLIAGRTRSDTSMPCLTRWSIYVPTGGSFRCTDLADAGADPAENAAQAARLRRATE